MEPDPPQGSRTVRNEGTEACNGASYREPSPFIVTLSPSANPATKGNGYRRVRRKKGSPRDLRDHRIVLAFGVTRKGVEGKCCFEYMDCPPTGPPGQSAADTSASPRVDFNLPWDANFPGGVWLIDVPGCPLWRVLGTRCRQTHPGRLTPGTRQKAMDLGHERRPQ